MFSLYSSTLFFQTRKRVLDPAVVGIMYQKCTSNATLQDKNHKLSTSDHISDPTKSYTKNVHRRLELKYILRRTWLKEIGGQNVDNRFQVQSDWKQMEAAAQHRTG